jgi:multisubunit Na+/H+ antiporter MnhF subunit
MHEAIAIMATVWLTALLVVMVIVLIRARSPMTRILALDSLTLFLIALLVVYASANESRYFLDAAVILGLLSFVASLVTARYHSERKVFD